MQAVTKTELATIYRVEPLTQKAPTEPLHGHLTTTRNPTE